MNSFSNILATKKEEKEDNIFHCKSCDFKCCNKYNWNRHLTTRKHIRATTSNIKEEKELSDYLCDKCNKTYESRNGLWRHKKICTILIDNKKIDNSEIKILTGLVIDVVNQNKELFNYNKELTLQNQTLTDKIVDICKISITNNSNSNNNIISNSHINSHNKTFNLQFFLNETCKDAMNISEFVDSIKLELSDLMELGEIGYVEGMSKIIVKNLNDLNETKRPIHCTDKKREIFYIKDEDKWEKEDEDKKKLRKIIFRISNKNIKLLQTYKELHPGCNFSESKFADQYSKLVIEAVGGAGNNDTEKENKIIRNISKKVTIKKLTDDLSIIE